MAEAPLVVLSATEAGVAIELLRRVPLATSMSTEELALLRKVHALPDGAKVLIRRDVA